MQRKRKSCVTQDSNVKTRQLMTSKLRKSETPEIGSFEEDADPVGFAKTVAKEYATMEDGYHAKLRGFLRRAYDAYDLFREFPGTFEELKQDPFWEISRQKPKDLTTSKWVLLFIMQAKTPNVRIRASKYAKILDRFTRDGVKVGQVEGRISALGGVEAAYEHMVATEQGRALSSADRDDEEMENEGGRIPRKGKLRASRDGDAKVRGEQIDAETGSPSETGRDLAVSSRWLMTSIDPERSLIVELEPAQLERIVGAGDKRQHPVSFRLEITAYPRDAKGFARVVDQWVTCQEMVQRSRLRQARRAEGERQASRCGMR